MPIRQQTELRLMLEPPLALLWEEMKRASGLSDGKLFTIAASTLAHHMEALSNNQEIIILEKESLPKQIVLPGQLAEPFKRLSSPSPT
ncbi:MAG: hypothetical protein G01um1014107_161 [Parcubacteria group bacterium Gr01-1014_107]|nr:MAG: hypothetical protein G01um1014107_161 [Parcubacteria group bacterium Gr01-1014_107]